MKTTPSESRSGLRLFKRLVKQEELELVGRGRAAYYRLAAGTLEDDAR